MTDPINPSYYERDGVRCADFRAHLPTFVSDAFKYIWRAGEKGDAIEDLKKAEWYLREAIRLGLRVEKEKRRTLAGMYCEFGFSAEPGTKKFEALAVIVSDQPRQALDWVRDLIRELEAEKADAERAEAGKEE